MRAADVTTTHEAMQKEFNSMTSATKQKLKEVAEKGAKYAKMTEQGAAVLNMVSMLGR